MLVAITLNLSEVHNTFGNLDFFGVLQSVD
jgi:hypothetical protein